MLVLGEEQNITAREHTCGAAWFPGNGHLVGLTKIFIPCPHGKTCPVRMIRSIYSSVFPDLPAAEAEFEKREGELLKEVKV